MDFLSIAITGLELVAILAVILSMVIIKKRNDRIRLEEKLKKDGNREHEEHTRNGYHSYQPDMSDADYDLSYLSHRNGSIFDDHTSVVITKRVNDGLEVIGKGAVDDLHMDNVPGDEPQFIAVGDISYNIGNQLGNARSCATFSGKFQDNIDVAVKVIPYDTESNRKFQENLIKKIKYEPDFGSNHLAKYYSVERITNDGKLCLALASELCPWNLAQFIHCEEMRKIPFTEACKQMLTGLRYLHDNGISHRNLKPSNVLITGKETGFTFKLADFGNIACPKIFSKNNNIITEGSSDGWIAPEVFNDARNAEKSNVKFDPSADVFSMGMLCVFIQSQGKMLFESQNQIQHNDFNMNLLEESGEPFKQLVSLMTDVDTNKRPNCEECLKHPTFWDSVKVLDFLKSSTGVIQTDGNLMETIEKGAGYVVKYNWREHLTKGVEGYIFSPTRRRGSRALYTQDSVRLLLRAIRVLREHFSELPMHVQVELGFYTEDYTRYWTDRFPHLLMHVYNNVQMVQKN